MSILTPDYLAKMPKLGFGMMRMPMLDEEIDMVQVKAMVDHYMDAGMNYFDTAWFYHGGKSELVLKEAVVERYPREAFTIADKMPIWEVNEPADVERIFNEQLERCGVEYFDFYLLHALDGEKNKKCEDMGAYEFCLRMKEEGKIKSFGFSFHGSTDDIKHILASHPEYEFVQLQINYYDWEFDYKDQYEVVRSYDLPIVVMEPVRGGFLAKMPREIEENFKAHHPNMSVASWALRWVTSLPGVVISLSGMSNMEQLVDNVSFMKDFNPLNDTELEIVRTAAQQLVQAPTIPCTDCKYCIDCPIEIPIFDIFGVYNEEFVNNKNLGGFKEQYSKFDASINASACVACTLCESVCPQNIPIIERLADIATLVE